MRPTILFITLLMSVLFCSLLSLPVWSEEVSESEILNLPKIDLLDTASQKTRDLKRESDRFNFTEEASGEVDLLNEKKDSVHTLSAGPRLLPQPLEKGIGKGLKGIEQLTSPITKPREFRGPGKDRVIEFDPASEKPIKMEF